MGLKQRLTHLRNRRPGHLLPFRIPFFRIFYSTTYTTLYILTLGLLAITPVSMIWGAIQNSAYQYIIMIGGTYLLTALIAIFVYATIISLLNLPLELPPDAPARKAGLKFFTDGLGEWVGRCQTYEGGIGAAPSNEAHGAYAFCALACLSILDAPHVSIPKYLDAEALAAWLAARQTRAEGGFQGRQEKLVDACYSHWVGGCWDLIQAALPDLQNSGGEADVWNREALIRYLLTCCQAPGKKGGMRDKPSTHPDAYHTCYSIAGLSHAQNRYHYDSTGEFTDGHSGRLTAAFNWHAKRPSQETMKALKVGQEDLVGFVHPVFVVPMEVAQAVKEQFKDGGL